MGKLTVAGIKRITKAGRYGDGNGLCLLVQKGGGRSWVQRLTVRGRRVDRGLGSLRFVTLAEARDLAFENMRTARRGGDPFEGRQRVPSFRVACESVEDAAAWKGRTPEQRRAALDTYAARLLPLRVDAITRADVIAVLRPIWTSKPALARQLRGWIRGALAWAQAHGYVDGNAADGIDAALPKRTGNGVKHYAALEYREVGAALAKIDARNAAATTKACLRFIALTAVRSGEARFAKWSEIDLATREWRIPADRMKGGVEHRVPLSDAAVSVLESVRPLRRSDDLVFPSGRGAVDDSTLRKFLRRVAGNVTVHGFRSGFRSWCQEQTSYPHAVCEMALAHRVGSDVERSYARSDLFDKRRALMAEWAAYLTDGATADAVIEHAERLAGFERMVEAKTA